MDDQERILLSHVDDLCARAKSGVFCTTAFLTPGEQREVSDRLRQTGHFSLSRFYGGFSDAQRRCLLLFPDYAIDCADPALSPIESIRQLLSLCGEEDPVQPLLVRGSGFCELTHRDYLGSLLSLGIEREVLGDIERIDAHSAYVFCSTGIARYLEENCERIANDRVRVQKAAIPATYVSTRETMPLSDTVASNRLDCVVAALVNCSRERAKELIRDCRVELDDKTEERADRSVATPAMISVRGVGKFRVLSMATQTKKGRYRLSAEKFIG